MLSIGSLDGSEATDIISIPGLLSFLATGDWDAEVKGINNLNEEYAQTYASSGITNFAPNIPVTYWTFRLMIGFGMLAALYALWALWAYRGDRRPRSRWAALIGITLPLLPLFAASFGWIFTEMGRQPWIVFGLMATSAGVSPIVGTFQVWVSVIGFTLLYAVLAVIEIGLIIRTVKQGPPEVVVDPFVDRELETALTISY